jgi:hypothetical protein
MSAEENNAYLSGLEGERVENEWDCLKYYNIINVKIMISPIVNLIAVFFKWGIDMLPNITLAGNIQCMKFKMLYDNYKRMKLFIHSNQPVIPFQTRTEVKDN